VEIPHKQFQKEFSHNFTKTLSSILRYEDLRMENPGSKDPWMQRYTDLTMEIPASVDL